MAGNVDRLYRQERAEGALAESAHQKARTRCAEVVGRITEINREVREARRVPTRHGLSVILHGLYRERDALKREQRGLEDEMARLRPYRGVAVIQGTTSVVLEAVRRLRATGSWDSPERVEASRRTLLDMLEQWVEKGGERGTG